MLFMKLEANLFAVSELQGRRSAVACIEKYCLCSNASNVDFFRFELMQRESCNRALV